MNARSRLGWLFVLSTACAGDGAGADRLQSSCVQEEMGLERTLVDGAECSNFGYADCPAGDMASKCVHTCAFDRCQSASCQLDTDCASVSSGLECQAYVVSGTDYGKWCGVPECPKGKVGCPCGAGGACLVPDSYWVVSCSAASKCEGQDTCPAGCRAGSVCCGGAFCGGDCVGTSCC